MPLLLLKIAKWFLSKGILWVTAGAVAVIVFALWIFVRDSYREDGQKVTALTQLQERAAVVYSELESAHGRLIELAEEIEDTRRKIEAADKVIAYFDGILNRIERFITMSAQERAAAEAKLEEAKKDKERQLELRKALVGEQSALRIDRIAFSEEAKQLEAKIGALEGLSSSFVEHLEEAWQRLKPYLLFALLSAILVPIAWKLFAFYVWAPLLSAGGPIRLWAESLPLPLLAQSGVSASVSLLPKQKLWVKESYLQASDESLKRQTRFVLDWSIPATCLAAGLVEMVEFTGQTDGESFVTVSPQRRSDLEIAVVEVPEAGRLVVRPSSIAGLVSRSGGPIGIVRRWRLFHPQAWLTFQFRYFVFEGPCSVIVSGVRGVRFEKLDSPAQKGRRSNQIATIGFTPDLGYGVVRAETFWAYFRGFNPLFDDVFRGKGVFLCQEISEEEASKATRFWSGLWSGVLKVLGI